MTDDPDAWLPEALPAGERVLWQGRPCWRTLMRRAFHARPLAVYLGVLLAWYAAASFAGGVTGMAVLGTLRMAAIATIPVALLCLYAVVTSRMARYLITDRRLVLRVGIALPVTLNLPFAHVQSASLALWPDGHGSLALALAPGQRIAYALLWPHARPWRLARPEPTLRCVPEAERVAQILSRALAAASDMAVADLPVASKAASRAAGAPALA